MHFPSIFSVGSDIALCCARPATNVPTLPSHDPRLPLLFRIPSYFAAWATYIRLTGPGRRPIFLPDAFYKLCLSADLVNPSTMFLRSRALRHPPGTDPPQPRFSMIINRKCGRAPSSFGSSNFSLHVRPCFLPWLLLLSSSLPLGLFVVLSPLHPSRVWSWSSESSHLTF